MIKNVKKKILYTLTTLFVLFELLLWVGYKENFSNKYTGSLLFWLIGIIIMFCYAMIMRRIFEIGE